MSRRSAAGGASGEAGTTRVCRVLFILALVAFTAHVAHAASRYDPKLRFRTIATPHFSIYFHQGEETLARRLAGIAEEVSGRLAADLGRPRARVHVVLVAQSDTSNGWAMPTPYNLIELDAASPRPASTIGNTDDWLRLVFTHEYTHIVHLEKARGWAAGLRRVFGSNPVLFPNLFLPQWQIEGLATYTESAVTGAGRVPASDFRLMLDRAAAAGRLEPLDRASGGLVDWPSGNAPYLYGAYFHQYLADRYGADSFEQLATVTAGRVPYFGTPAFRKVYGRSLGELWADFEAASRPNTDVPSPVATRLTRIGFNVRAPWYTAEGRLFYAVSSPHRFPALVEHAAGANEREVVTAHGTAQISSAGRRLIFDQLETVRNVGLQSDIYALDLDSGAVQRLTHGARAAEPDISPDGRRIACIVQQPDRRLIAEFDSRGAGDPSAIISEPFTDYSAPRWSPDGSVIAAERRRQGGPSEIVLIDPEARAVRELVSTPAGRNVQPAWLTRDTILFASDRAGTGFALYAVDVKSRAIRRLADAGSGAQFPAASPDGRSLAFVSYSPAGYDLFSIDLTKATWIDAGDDGGTPGDPPLEDGDHAGTAPAADRAGQVGALATSAGYTPWGTLAPRLWTPILLDDSGEVVAGGMTAGIDALGRHSYALSAGWSVSRARPDWDFEYAYDRWWPTLFADLSDDTDPWRAGEIRSVEANAGVVLPVRRVRWVQATLAAVHASRDRFACPGCEPAVDSAIQRRSVRFGSAFNNAKSFGYSISRESGLSASATAELTRRALGADGDANAWTVDLRGYLRAFPRHAVLAARAAGAASSGDGRVRQVFSASGSGPRGFGFGFGLDAIGLMRGFDEDAVAGPRAAVVNLDYRFPLAYVQRGIGTLPFFLRAIHGAVFVDAGNAWSGAFDASEVRASAGAELSADTVLGYVLPATFTAGVAWRQDPSGRQRGVAYFGRLGWAF